MDRRMFLKSSCTVAATGFTGGLGVRARSERADEAALYSILSGTKPILNLHRLFPSPVQIRSIEVLRARRGYYLRSVSGGGAVGIVKGIRIPHVLSLLKEVVIPYFTGKDARDVESLVDGVYRDGSRYKYAGLAFWVCVGNVELSLFDMLGKMADKPAGALLGKVIRSEIPVYLSSLTRETTPQEEVQNLCDSLSKTGAKAVKLKVGGRMRNGPRDIDRTNRLIPLARKTFGDRIAIYVDSNGSYTAKEAIEVGRMLEEHDVGFFEEPCPWQEYEQTKRVADALKVPVAGGEQDSSLAQFDWMIRNGVLDLVQPDLYYNGGFIRCLRVARMAEKAGMKITPHSPKTGAEALPMLHFASVVRNLGPHQEFRASSEIDGGCVRVPTGPGLGINPDAEGLGKAETI